jgi:hypothetical protein
VTSRQNGHAPNASPQPHGWSSANPRRQMNRISPAETQPSIAPIARSTIVLPLRA